LKHISILGSTGSIGIQTLDIIKNHPDLFKIEALSAGKNIERLKSQIEIFHPSFVSVANKGDADLLSSKLDYPVEISHGLNGLIKAATYPKTDIVVVALSGSIGVLPTFYAIQKKKRIALANKEVLVMAGRIIMEESKEKKVRILPVDSEHSAIFQAIKGHCKNEIKDIILTASGGPFFNFSEEELKNVTIEDALAHPVWKMGKKITIDSATMINKAMEIIEARWLFDIPPEKIKVFIHPQSFIHSMVEYIDGSIIAQMAFPDMRIPISYALFFPKRGKINVPCLSAKDLPNLSFYEPDFLRFPAIKLAYEALKAPDSMSAVLNISNEVAVNSFLKGELPFYQIVNVVKQTMDAHIPHMIKKIEDLYPINEWAKNKAMEIIDKIKRKMV